MFDVTHRTRVLALAALGAAALGFTANAQADDDIGFAKPQFVSTTLAGGEPLVMADTVHHTLLYTSHEGTTHLYRNGFATIPVNWLANYRNQVNNWYSDDNGKTWHLGQVAGAPTSAGFMGSPTMSQGFSDPDLTMDKGGRIYNTGINLATDSIFSTADGGKTWDKGTAQCHEGDRPWLAGSTDKADTAWLATNSSVTDHTIVETDDGGNTCNGTTAGTGGGIPDPGGNGKLFYNPVFHELVEPNGNGVAYYKPGVDTAFHKGPNAHPGGIFAHWPSLAIDKAGTLYMVWDTANNANGQGCPSTLTGGQANTDTAKPNAIQYAYSRDDGRTWSSVKTVQSGDYGANGHVEFWPWLAAGDDGRINIVWYEADRSVDIDCAPVSINIKTTTITDADTKAPHINVADAAGRAIHYGTVCQGGTTCVATGEDRRLGDFFTQAPDQNGCVMIASGDTTQWDNTTFTTMPYSLPIFIRQNKGPSLYKGIDCGHVG